MPRKKSKPWDTFGKGRPGWDAYITPYVGNDYQKFCKALVPHMRSDKPDDDLAFVKTLGPVNLAVSLASPSFSLPEEGTTRRPTVTTLIVPLYMEAKLSQFYQKNQPKECPETNALSDLLEESFVLGEIHSDISSKRFLIENMQTLKENGFTTLYFEHLFYDNQNDLEEFHKTGEMSEYLEQHLMSLDMGNELPKDGEFTFLELVYAAQKAGIRVVAIDTAATYCTQKASRVLPGMATGGDTRGQYFSYTASKIIEADIKKGNPGKWMALMGSAHISTYKNVPGVGELLGVRRVNIDDNKTAPHIGLNEKKAKDLIDVEINLQVDPTKSTKISDLEKMDITNAAVAQGKRI